MAAATINFLTSLSLSFALHAKLTSFFILFKNVSMTKKKSSTHKKPVYSRIKNPVKPRWMRITKVISIILLSILMLLAIAGMVIKYYRLVTQ
ncbi:hypothetical protein CK934_00755 [Chitinophaga sp. MD30]|nr:hypothetical protein CK934_00755 [Chitinophaga sp. MD30]